MNFYSRTFIIIATVLLSLGYGVWESKQLESSIVDEAQTILKKIPEASFSIPFVDGTFLTSSFSKDKVKFVHFWATWCGPCLTELPELFKLIKKYQAKNIEFILVAVNDNDEDIKKYLKKFGMYEDMYTLLVDNKNVHREKFGTVKIPETFIFNKSGVAIRKFTGPQDWKNTLYANYLDKKIKIGIPTH
jgi:cytochrome c biogenesis protein CcmG/thiol:disulfide interchange protein DsbE